MTTSQPSELPALLDAMHGFLDDYDHTLPGSRWPRLRRGHREPLCPLLRWLVWHRDNGTCRFCGRADLPTEIDHVIPWSANGPDTATNLRVLCQPCNQDRSNYRVLETPRLVAVTRVCDSCTRDEPDPMFHRQDNLVHNHACRVCEGTWWTENWIIGEIPAQPAFCGHCMQVSAVSNPGRLL